MTRQVVSFELSGNQDAVRRVVRRALDAVGLTEVPFSVSDPGGEPSRCSISSEHLRELVGAAERCVAAGVDWVRDDVSARAVGEMAREILASRARALDVALNLSRPDVAAVAIDSVGKLTRVDAYECREDKLRVEVERVPGTDDVQSAYVSAFMRDELPGVSPTCPVCEREMIRVGSKLRRGDGR